MIFSLSFPLLGTYVPPAGGREVTVSQQKTWAKSRPFLTGHNQGAEGALSTKQGCKGVLLPQKDRASEKLGSEILRKALGKLVGSIVGSHESLQEEVWKAAEGIRKVAEEMWEVIEKIADAA